MIRLVLFLLLIGLVLYTVARVMSALKGGDNNASGPDEISDQNSSADDKNDSDNDQ